MTSTIKKSVGSRARVIYMQLSLLAEEVSENTTTTDLTESLFTHLVAYVQTESPLYIRSRVP